MTQRYVREAKHFQKVWETVFDVRRPTDTDYTDDLRSKYHVLGPNTASGNHVSSRRIITEDAVLVKVK